MSTVEDQEIVELNKKKFPVVVIDESLNKYHDIVLFPEKLKKANETLEKTGHPEKYINIK